MALTTMSSLTANFAQPLNTNVITTNFTTLPFLSLGNATTDLPLLIPDQSLFSTDLPSFLSNSLNSINNTFTDYDFTFDNNGTMGANSSSSNENTYDITNKEEEEVNPFLANDYNFYDYNPYDPNSTSVQEPYDYSASVEASDSKESGVKRDEVLKKFDGVNNPPPVRPILYDALTDLNPWFLWTPPFFCFLGLILITLPCLILKLVDDQREKQGKKRLCGNSRRKSIIRRQVEEKTRVKDLENQSAAASAFAKLPRNAYSDIHYVAQVASKANEPTESKVKNSRAYPGLVIENVLYNEENDFSKKKENGELISKRLAVDEPPVDYRVEEEILAPRRPSKEETGDQNVELHHHSSSSGSLSPAEAAAASGETSLGSSSEPERRAEWDEDSEEEEDEVRAHRSGNFSTAPKTYTNFTGWNRDLYSNGAGFGPPVRKSSSKQEGGSSSRESADPVWKMY